MSMLSAVRMRPCRWAMRRLIGWTCRYSADHRGRSAPCRIGWPGGITLSGVSVDIFNCGSVAPRALRHSPCSGPMSPEELDSLDLPVHHVVDLDPLHLLTRAVLHGPIPDYRMNRDPIANVESRWDFCV